MLSRRLFLITRYFLPFPGGYVFADFPPFNLNYLLLACMLLLAGITKGVHGVGPFLESPGDFSGPEQYFKTYRIVV